MSGNAVGGLEALSASASVEVDANIRSEELAAREQNRRCTGQRTQHANSGVTRTAFSIFSPVNAT
jgi:hypothetical protein